MNGGGEKATYRFSLGYMSDIGTTIGTSMNRLNTSMVINYQFSNKLKFGADFSYSQTNTDANWVNTIRSEALSKMPNKSPFTVNDLTGALTMNTLLIMIRILKDPLMERVTIILLPWHMKLSTELYSAKVRLHSVPIMR